MQIDIHYYATYAMARLAGIRPDAAKTIATASQYVDDAIEENIQHHENGSKLVPIVTAHSLREIIDNRDVNDQPFVWLPFHFFPGNEGTDFTERLICRKDSPLINELIDHYLDLHDRPFALELIGLAAHVYADTFSHAGFSGVSSRRNKVDAGSITPGNATAPTATYLERKMGSFFSKFGLEGGLWTNIRRTIISDTAETASGALGHGAVATLPDLPYLEWSFEYEQSSEISERNNPRAFLEACEKLHKLFQRFASRGTAHDDGTSGVNFGTVEERVKDILSFQNGKTERSEKWRTAFTNGQLGIKPGEEIPPYDHAPWDKQRDHFPAMDKPEKIAASNVYHFYQAASLHRHYILRELMPKHELVVV
ncbi:MAG: hypothetical protein SRB1_02101 [Desulfobacteraceae bacterium Eth-SRB1]|nr:MAG: hypothetical protein SRB1_02101 [Desulfobacteraceae bacterium Eth-SRB1]